MLSQLSSVVVDPVLAVIILHAFVSHTLGLDNLPHDEGEEDEVDEDDEKDGEVIEEEDPVGVWPAAEEALLLLSHPGVEHGGGWQADVKDSENAGE